MRRKAFTLIELITVIAILSIVAAIILPRFVGTQTQATEKQEDAIITSFKEAVNHQHMQNIVSGVGDIWPGDTGSEFPVAGDPFSIFSNAPPHAPPPPPVPWFVPPDNVRWRYWKYLIYYFILCPHHDGDACNDNNSNTKGRMYIYRFGNGSNPYNLEIGQVYKHSSSKGH